MMPPAEVKAFAIQRALSLGFVAAGVAPAGRAAHAGALRRWVAQGRHASMAFMERNLERRCDVRANWPWAASVLCLAAPCGSAGPPGQVARFARGRDYHDVLKRRLKTLARELAERAPGLRAVCCVDTASVLERDLAASAGLGWIGRNACLVHPIHGSYLVLGEIVLSLALPGDRPLPDGCGDCRQCLAGCPNGALVAPYVLDARRCNSWATIENDGPLDGERFDLAGQVFGCDLCQQVCPYNERAVAALPEFQTASPAAAADVSTMLSWSPPRWRLAVQGSALARLGHARLVRNAAIVAGQCRLVGAREALERLAGHDDPRLSAAGRWALERLRSAGG